MLLVHSAFGWRRGLGERQFGAWPHLRAPTESATPIPMGMEVYLNAPPDEDSRKDV